MRANPPHIGHQTVVDQVLNAAKTNNGGHTVFLSRSFDKFKNPLTPEQKIKHVRKAFPNANVELTSPDSPTLLHQASKLHDQGVNNLNVHVGSDRVDSFHKILNDYNGKAGKHGYYNFKNINVLPVGGDRNDSDDLEGASATKMRAAVASGNKKVFHSMAPSNMSQVDKDSLYSDVHAGMNPVKEEPKPKKSK